MAKFLSYVGAFFLDLIETVAIALSIFLVIYLFLVQPHQVNGQSMEPNFESGEYLLTDKVSYRFNDPQRGDIIVFRAPPASHCPEGTGCDFIKRIIGLPGDKIEIKNSHFYINDQLLEEPYLADTVRTKPGDFMRTQPVRLGPMEYFVSGDNRSYSSDSRSWGPILRSDIIGKAIFRYWPLESMGVIQHVSYEEAYELSGQTLLPRTFKKISSI